MFTEQDNKMKKMADLQMNGNTDPRNRLTIERQVAQWNFKLEEYHVELYELKCYMAAVQGAELPNPQVSNYKFG
jgi:T-lymphoma invasion and metastasis-inducing protein 2